MSLYDREAVGVARRMLPVLRDVDVASRAAGDRLGVKCPTDPGCSACCNKITEIHLADALVLVDHIYKKMPKLLPHFVARAEAHVAAFMQLDLASEWFTNRKGCVFLEPDQSCAVYEARPTTCRVHSVVSDPMECEPDAMGDYAPVDAGALEDSSTKTAKRLLRESGLKAFVTGPLQAVFLLAVRFYKGSRRGFMDELPRTTEVINHALDLFAKEEDGKDPLQIAHEARTRQFVIPQSKGI